MTRFSSILILLVCAALGLSSLPARAQSLTGNVGSANISQGERAFEARYGFNELGEAAGRVHYEHALGEDYLLRLITTFSQADGERWEFDAATLENWFQWREEAADGSGFNGGLRLAYGFSTNGEPDEAEARLTLTDRFADAWEWRANLIVEREVGADRASGVFLETRTQLSRAVSLTIGGVEDTRLGVELFSEYGSSEDLPGFQQQAHQLGPIVKLSWSNGVYLQTGARFGLTRAADDSMAKLFIGREF